MNIIQIPYLISFDRLPYRWFQDINMLVCLINIIINSNKSFYSKGNLVTDHLDILIEFLKIHFIYDLIAIIVMYYNYHKAPEWHSYFLMFFLIKFHHFD